MRWFARVLLAVFALTLAASAFVQRTAAKRMDMPVPMAISGPAGEPMPDCDDCGGDPDEGMACWVACTLPALAVLAPEVGSRPLVKHSVQPLTAGAIVGMARPPDPYPPRPAI